LEPAGLVGYVRDTAGNTVAGAKVYLVPVADIPAAPLVLTDITAERASTADEPLEDTIAAKGATYLQGVADANGMYRIATVAAGSNFVVVIPSTDSHLPGGSLCRKAMAQGEMAGKQLNIEISTQPSAKAEYVGPSVCVNCHGMVHEWQTLHMNGLRKIGAKIDIFGDGTFDPTQEGWAGIPGL
jgi:hypothetical protein